MKKNIALLSGLFFLIYMADAQTAWYYQWGLMPEKNIDLLIGESSGEKAYNHIITLSDPYRQRTTPEYSDIFFETRYIAEKLEEYGLPDVKVERLGKTNIWRCLKAELWETEPEPGKIIDAAEIPFSVIPGSSNTDVTAELVYVGSTAGPDLDRLDLRGKIVLTASRPSSLHNMLLQKEAAGIVSFYNGSSYVDEILIPDPKGYGIRKDPNSGFFSFNIPFREGEILRRRLQSGEKITLHAGIKIRNEEADIQVPSCVIPGTDPSSGEIIISAHLFEGYGNQGANDNISGSAVIIEVAGMLNRLISSGTVERPRRSIRFIWVPEFSGTIPWVAENRNIISRTLCNINLDMVGLSLSQNKSYFILHRTTYGNAHYMNDVIENYYRYVGETNQVNSVITASSFIKRIVSPSGTEDPFYYQIESASGGSDHMVFNDWGVGVPGVLMITWPDPFYHTSLDRYDKMDPTQLKRVIFITAASSYNIAIAGEDDAINIAGEVYGNSIRRIGYQVAKSFDELNKSGADDLYAVYSRVSGNIMGTLAGEIRTLNSVNELVPGSTRLNNLLQAKQRSLSDFTEDIIANLTRTAEMIASHFGMPPFSVSQTPAERRAASLIPALRVNPLDIGYNGWRKRISDLPSETRERYAIKGMDREQQDEAIACVDGKASILEIKHLIDAQNPVETSIQNLENFFNLLREASLVRF